MTEALKGGGDCLSLRWARYIVVSSTIARPIFCYEHQLCYPTRRVGWLAQLAAVVVLTAVLRAVVAAAPKVVAKLT